MNSDVKTLNGKPDEIIYSGFSAAEPDFVE